jgi:hypothetical protein
MSPGEDVLVEVFAHQGRMRPGQINKVAKETLKLVTLSQQRPAARLILAFADQTAARCVQGRSWLSEAIVAWNVEIFVVTSTRPSGSAPGRRRPGRSWSTLTRRERQPRLPLTWP